MASTFLTGLLAGFLTVQFGANAPEQPWRQPQVAASGSAVAIVFGAGKAVYFSLSRDQGRSFSPPVKVAESPVLALGRHRGPRVAFAGRAIVVSAVTGKNVATGVHAHGLPADGDLVAWRSLDSGKTWSSAIVINDAPGSAMEGLHGMASDGHGRLFAAWLDTRQKGKQLYGALSTDDGATWSKNVLIYQSPDGTICQCCHPSVAIDDQGRISVMWRNALAGMRDMYVMRSRDGIYFLPPEKQGRGEWKLDACPMDGGGLAWSQGQPVTAWRRGQEVFLARPGQAERKIGDGKDVALAAGKDGIFAVWSGPAGLQALTPAHAEARKLADEGAYPSVAALPQGGAVAAWESQGRIQVEILP